MNHCNYCHAVLFKTDKKAIVLYYSKQDLISYGHIYKYAYVEYIISHTLWINILYIMYKQSAFYCDNMT